MTKNETNAPDSRRRFEGERLSSFRHSNFVIRHSFDRFEFRLSNFRSKSAFTLIELMISIALVLLLILGVNQIFTYTTQAVGAGQAMTAAIRDSRAAQNSFAGDFAAMVAPGGNGNDAAFMYISNYSSAGYRDKTDLASDRDANPWTRDLKGSGFDGDPSVPGDIVQPYQYNYRNHRFDILSFFARDLFHRQTGNPGTYVDNMSSQEALIWYGHLWLPDNTGSYPLSGNVPNTFPGFGSPSTNPNNYFATQFVLGRMAILLTEKNSATASVNPNGISDSALVSQWFIDRSAGPTSADLTPLTIGSPLNTSAGGSSSSDPSTAYLYNSRVDLASTSISNYRQKLTNFIAGNQAGTDWWDSLMNGYTTNSRYQCNPFVSKPMQSVDLAHAAPFMLGGCSQFTVEYAGDYMSQDGNPTDANYGQITSTTVGDGQIDFVMVPPNGNTGAPANQWRKQIIWYGLPRNTSGIGTVNPFLNGDVVPLQAWLQKYGTNGAATNASFEHYWPTLTFDGSGNLPSTQAPQPYSPYLCAWGPKDKPPSLIRITLTVDDPTGRLPEGQTYQYVFAVPPQ